jgi:hypothetical protein
MAKAIQLFDFCTSGIKKAAKSYNLGTPLDVVSAVGLTSFGCSPLIAHLLANDQSIFSEFNQKDGVYKGLLLTTANDSGITGAFPNLKQCLPYGAYIAGLNGVSPVLGTAVNPFPTTEPDRTLLWSVGGAGFTKVVNGTPQDLGSDVTAFDRSSSGLAMRGFGGTNLGSSGGGTLVQLPPDSREYNGGTRLRANHHYVPFLKLPYVPSLQPLLMLFDASHGYYIDPGSIFAPSADDGICQVDGYASPVCPCLISRNGDLGFPGANELSGPSLTRDYNFFRLTPFTLPGFGGSYAGTYDIPRSDCRAFLCVYVDSGRVDNVTCNEGASLGSTSVSIPTPGNGPPSAFTPVFPGIAFDTLYQFSIVGNEATYSFNVTHGSKILTTTAAVLHGDGTHIRCFEVFLDMHAAGNPLVLCT